MTEPSTKVLIVEDEQSFADALRSGLEQEGFAVQFANDGESALVDFEAAEPDIVLLDVMLPKMSGIDVCREIRSRSSKVPVIMVTARNSEIDTVVGLEVGADDYVAKPYRLRELVARIRSVLRRSTTAASENTPEGVITAGPVQFDTGRHEVRVRGDVIQLPLKEFELLGVLVANAGRVLPRETLIRRVWGEDYVGDTKTLDVHIKRLRAKVEAAPSQPVHICTVRGLGYKFEADDKPCE